MIDIRNKITAKFSNISQFVQTNWKAISVVASIIAAGSAVYLTNKTAQEALNNVAGTIQSTGADFFDWLEGIPSRAVREEELQIKIRKIKEEGQREIRKIEEEYENDRINTEIMWEEEKIRDKEESERLAKEGYQDWLRNLYWEITDPKSTLEQECQALDPIDFKEMSDFERLIHPDLNPDCCEHAKILLTPKGIDYSLKLFSSVAKINSLWRQLSKRIHPDLNPSLTEAAKALEIAGRAREILKLCLFQ